MMKALLVTAVGAVLIASGGMNAVKGEQVEAPAQKATFSHYSEGYHYNYNASVADEITQLPEYKTLSAKTDLSGYSVQTVEDNFSKRILLFKDGNSHAQYKTIFMKKTGVVKVIHL
ncbi:hypothetical protein KDN24_03870 [Bacillus sp. Bva_UNVM-123]|uniref:hypothetical protein n=1 Tax=Bacillus sp. Bva_UNVM-123 TaxID=2829798 RepID=UPI00391F6087